MTPEKSRSGQDKQNAPDTTALSLTSEIAALIESASLGLVVLSSDGTVQASNVLVSDALETGAADLQGRDFAHFLDAGSRGQFEEILTLIAAGDTVASRPLTMQTPAGRQFRASISGRALGTDPPESRDIFILVRFDPEERRRELEKSEERFRTIANFTYDWEGWFDPNGRPIWVSPSVERITGYTPDECLAIEDFPMSLVHEEDRPAVLAAFRGAAHGTSGNDLEFRVHRKDGLVVWGAVSWQPVLSESGRMIGYRTSVRDISKRKAADRARQESEEKYRVVAENSIQGMAILKGDPPRAVYANPAMAEITGYTVEEFNNLPREDFLNLMHPEDTWILERYRARLRGEPVPSRYEGRLVRRDGSIMWIELLATRVMFNNEPAVQLLMLDLTARREAETALRLRDQILEAVAFVGETLLKSEDWEDVIDVCLERLCKAAETARCGITINTRDQQGRLVSTPTHLWLDKDRPPLRRSDGVVDVVLEELGPRVYSRLTSGNVFQGNTNTFDEVERAAFEDWGATAVVLVPVYVENEFWGLVGFDEVDQPRDWSPSELDALKVAAGLLGSAIERRRTVRALRESESRWRSLVTNALGYIVNLDLAGRVRFVNRLPAALSPDDVIGTPFAGYMRPDHVDEFERRFRVVAETGEIQAMDVHGREDIDDRWFSLRLGPIMEGDNITGVNAFLTDVTERRLVEEALQKSEEKFAKAFKSSPDGVILSRFSDGTLIEINEGFLKMVGYTWHEAIGKTARELHYWADLSSRDTFTAMLERNGSVSDMESEFRHRDGRLIPIQISGRLIQIDGETCIISIVRDITQMKRALEALRESESRYRSITEDQTEFIVRWKPDGTRTFVNESYCRYFGLSRREAVGTSFMALVAPEDRHIITGKLRELTPDNPVRSDEHRVIKPDGSLAWQEWTDRAIFDREGRIFELQSVGRDVTERRIAQEERMKAEAILAASIEQSPVGILIADAPDVRIRVANSAALKIRGGAGEYLTEIPVELHPEHWQVFHPDGTPFRAEDLPLSRAILQGVTSYNVDAIIRRTDGEDRWVLASASPIKNSDGEIVAGVVVFADVTELKQTEDRLRESERFILSITEATPDQIYIYDFVERRLVYHNRSRVSLAPGAAPAPEEDPSPTVWIDAVHPDDVPAAEEAVSRWKAATDDDIVEFDFRMQAPGGEWRWLHSRNKVFRRDENGTVTQILGTAQDITERKEAERRISESEERFRLAFKTSPDAVNINRLSDGTYVDINEGFTHITGYTRDDVAGKTSLELGIWVNAHDRQRLVEGLKASGHVSNIEAPFRCKDGSTRIGLMSASIVDLTGEPHIISITRDIQELREAEIALRYEGERAKQYLDAAATLMVALDSDARIALINRIGADILGRTEEELIGMSWFDNFIMPAEREEVWSVFRRIMKGEIEQLSYYENAVLTRSDEVRLIAWYNTIIRDAETGRPTGVLSSGIDITERHKMEEELKLAHQRLEEEHDQLIKKNIALSEILGRIEDEKEAVKKNILENLEQSIMPTLQKLRATASSGQSPLLGMIEDDLRQLTSDFTTGLKNKFSGLTPRQLEICRMIKRGMTSKEIAEALGTSLLTIHKHREAIRDKLGLKNRGINLSSYLQSL